MAAREGTGGFTVRPATPGDLPDVHAVLASSGLRSGEPAALEFYLTSPGGAIVVACEQDRVTGVAYSVSFGRTGWLGNVAVDPGARGRGIGTAVSAAAIDRLRQAGAATVLLTATDLGRPLYQRLGFTDDGVRYGIWQRDPAPSGPVGTRVSQERLAEIRGLPAADGESVDVAEVFRPDAEATGEDRAAFLRPFAARARVTAGAAPAGYRIPLPWGGGPVIASGPAAARGLVLDMVRADANPSLSFPEPNTTAANLAAALGFRLLRRVTRMRLGPPVSGFRAERIFNAFSLAVG